MTDADRIAALERRVAELEKQRMWHIPQMPTFPQPFGGVIGLQAPDTPIRTDEVTCDFNPPSLDHNPTR